MIMVVSVIKGRVCELGLIFFFFKQKTAYEMRISDWSSDVCSSDLFVNPLPPTWGNIAKAHDRDGAPVALPRGYEAMPEMAASGLWPTPSDYARILVALIAAWRGGDKAFRSPAPARDMMKEVGPSRFGLDRQSVVVGKGGVGREDI